MSNGVIQGEVERWLAPDSDLRKLCRLLDSQMPDTNPNYSVDPLKYKVIVLEDHLRLEIVPMKCFFVFTEEGRLICGGNLHDIPGAVEARASK